MKALLALWLPVLVSTGFVFVLSSLIHMVFKWHAAEYGRLENEDAVRDALRAGNNAPGTYVLPHCGDMKAMAGEALQRKYREGPVGHVTLMPHEPPAIGRSLLQWVLLSLAISALVALLAGTYLNLRVGGGRAAFYLAGIVSFAAYGCGAIQGGIWEGKPWSSVLKHLFDAALYGAGTGLVFWWLWP